MEFTVYNLGVQFGESFFRRLKPVLRIVIPILSFNDVKSIDDSSLLAGVFLALVQQIAMNEDQVTGFNFSRDIVMLVFWLILSIAIYRREPRPVIIHHLCTGIARLTNKSLFYWCPAMRPWQKTETSVLKSSIFKGIPEAHSGRGVSVQESRVLVIISPCNSSSARRYTHLVRWHGTTDFWLFADDHALETSWILEAKTACHGRWADLASIMV
jgi:hypothetical protein